LHGDQQLGQLGQYTDRHSAAVEVRPRMPVSADRTQGDDGAVIVGPTTGVFGDADDLRMVRQLASALNDGPLHAGTDPGWIRPGTGEQV
jgi:hypothetical protein